MYCTLDPVSDINVLVFFYMVVIVVGPTSLKQRNIFMLLALSISPSNCHAGK